jgi:hypothetical protein
VFAGHLHEVERDVFLEQSAGSTMLYFIARSTAGL